MKDKENLLRVSFVHPCNLCVLCVDIKRNEKLDIEVKFLFSCPEVYLKDEEMSRDDYQFFRNFEKEKRKKEPRVGIGELIWGILIFHNVRKKISRNPLINVMSDNITISVMTMIDIS